MYVQHIAALVAQEVSHQVHPKHMHSCMLPLHAHQWPQAACEMITTAGGRLSKSERQETRKKLDDVMRRLELLTQDKAMAARIRFVIKDVADLKRSNWVPRREVFTAKKLDEVRAQAEAELGMISSSIAASLPTLPAMQQRMGGGGLVDEVPLIPPLRSETEAWGLFPPLRSQAPGGNGGMSALIGDFQEPRSAGAQQQPSAGCVSCAHMQHSMRSWAWLGPRVHASSISWRSMHKEQALFLKWRGSPMACSASQPACMLRAWHP